jgi:tRNA modification GTPase
MPSAGNRDVLSDRWTSAAVTLVDTVNAWATDAIEAEGIRRAEHARDIAALTLVAVDSSAALDAQGTRRLLLGAGGSKLVVITKVDRPRAWPTEAGVVAGVDPARAIPVSILTGEGLSALRRGIVEALTSRDHWRDPPAVSNARHLGLLGEAEAALSRAAAALSKGSTEELVLVELGQARQALEAITGRTTTDELLHHIFGRFCVGK